MTRVSTKEQCTDRQVTELTNYAAAKGLEVVEVIMETISGSRKNSDRPAIQKIRALAQAKKIDKVLVLEISRLGRDTAQVLETLEELHAHRVSLVCLNPQLETLDANGKENPTSTFLLTVLADLSRMEKLRLVERINSGLAEAKRKGVKLGRAVGYKKPLLKEYSSVVKLLKEGYSVRKTATLASVGVSTVQRVKKELDSAPTSKAKA